MFGIAGRCWATEVAPTFWAGRVCLVLQRRSLARFRRGLSVGLLLQAQRGELVGVGAVEGFDLVLHAEDGLVECSL